MDPLEPLGPRVGSALRQVVDALEQGERAYALIGANALLLRGVNLKRSTRDLDFVVVSEGGFPDLAAIAMGAGLRATPIAHRFYAEGGVEVDLLPLNPEQPNEIVLPGNIKLAALCLPEAIRWSSEVVVEAGSVNVAELPILVATKLLVATARRGDQDLLDAFAAMEAYVAEGERRFLEVDYGSQPELRYETAGAFLLARDLCQMVGPVVRRRLQTAVAQLAADTRMSEGQTLGRRYGALLKAFARGLERKRGQA